MDIQITKRRKSCDAGLVEDFGANQCVTVANLSCGKLNQRACDFFERSPACDKGLWKASSTLGSACVSLFAESDEQKAVNLLKTIAGNNAACFNSMAVFVDSFMKTNSNYLFNGGFSNDLKQRKVPNITTALSGSLNQNFPAACKSSFKGISFSLSADAGFGVAVGDEVGVAFSVTGKAPPATIYHALALSGGLITGGGGAVNIGLLTSEPSEMSGEGLGFSASAGPKVLAAGAGLSFNPDPPSAQSGTTYVIDLPHFAGVTFSVSAGISVVPVDIRATSSLTQLLTPQGRFESVDQSSCGKNNNRPCWVIERFPSCDSGLAEDIIQHKCV